MPVAVETFGVYAKEAEKFVAALGERLKTVSGDPRSLAFLKQRISLAVQRGNAAAVLGTLPHGKGFWRTLPFIGFKHSFILNSIQLTF